MACQGLMMSSRWLWTMNLPLSFFFFLLKTRLDPFSAFLFWLRLHYNTVHSSKIYCHLDVISSKINVRIPDEGAFSWLHKTVIIGTLNIESKEKLHNLNFVKWQYDNDNYHDLATITISKKTSCGSRSA